MLTTPGLKLIIGANGSGKTTFFNKLYQLKSHSCSYIPQQAPLYPELTIAELADLYYNLTAAQFKYLFATATHKNTLIKQLSAGFKQRLNLALGLNQPKNIIIIDEAAQNLDNNGLEELCQVIAQLKQKHIILLTHHEQHYFREISDATYHISCCQNYLS